MICVFLDLLHYIISFPICPECHWPVLVTFVQTLWGLGVSMFVSMPLLDLQCCIFLETTIPFIREMSITDHDETGMGEGRRGEGQKTFFCSHSIANCVNVREAASTSKCAYLVFSCSRPISAGVAFPNSWRLLKTLLVTICYLVTVSVVNLHLVEPGQEQEGTIQLGRKSKTTHSRFQCFRCFQWIIESLCIFQGSSVQTIQPLNVTKSGRLQQILPAA